MKKKLALLCFAGIALVVGGISISSNARSQTSTSEVAQQPDRMVLDSAFDVQILVDGRPLSEYYARGKSYVEALEGAEYEVRISNPSSSRVAVALSVDGLNTIDARRTTAWNASKWVIEPYGSINIGGWQMSSARARRFYFTSERDSYGAKLGQTSNLGIISAVFFREQRPIPMPVAPPPHPRPLHEEEGRDSKSKGSSASVRTDSSSNQRQVEIAPVPDDEYAATGIGRSVHNDVRWIDMELEARPAAEVVIRYEYYPALVRLGIVPRSYPRADPLRKRERATGFEDRRFSPEP